MSIDDCVVFDDKKSHGHGHQKDPELEFTIRPSPGARLVNYIIPTCVPITCCSTDIEDLLDLANLRPDVLNGEV
jgi:hypothetical protein